MGKRGTSSASGSLPDLPDPFPLSPLPPFTARVAAPGSKSCTNRALCLAALAQGQTELTGALDAEDTQVLRRALRAVGVTVEASADRWRVTGVAGRPGPAREPLDCRNSGTSLRFLAGLLPLGASRYLLTGSPRMEERPIGPLVEALTRQGVTVAYEGRPGFPPLAVTGRGGLPGGEITVRAAVSSQYVSGLLLAAPYARTDTTLRLAGPVVSRPYIDLTLRMMADFGGEAAWQDERSLRVVAGRRYQGRPYAVEGDWSNAAYLFGAAAAAGGTVTVANLDPDTAQGDRAILTVLERLGCRVRAEPDGVTVKGGPLRGLTYDFTACPDLAQPVAVLAALARGPSRLTGLSTLRHKETDRLAALETELRKLGAGASVSGDVLEVTPGPVRPCTVETYDDHRMAMSFALAGCRHPGIRLAGPACVAKTFPAFFAAVEALRAGAAP